MQIYSFNLYLTPVRAEKNVYTHTHQPHRMHSIVLQLPYPMYKKKQTRAYTDKSNHARWIKLLMVCVYMRALMFISTLSSRHIARKVSKLISFEWSKTYKITTSPTSKYYETKVEMSEALSVNWHNIRWPIKMLFDRILFTTHTGALSHPFVLLVLAVSFA